MCAEVPQFGELLSDKSFTSGDAAAAWAAIVAFARGTARVAGTYPKGLTSRESCTAAVGEPEFRN